MGGFIDIMIWMGKKPMNIIAPNQEPHSDVVALFLDKSITNRYPTIVSYAEENNTTIDPKAHLILVQFIEKLIYKQIVYYAYLMYHFMQSSNDWGPPGEEQVKITFCRNILKIDHNVQLTSEHAATFDKKIAETLKKLGIDSLSKDDALLQLRGYKFQMFGRSYELFQAGDLNRYLKFSGSNKFLHAGQYTSQMEFILGSGKSKAMHGYQVIYVEKEYIRTPNNVMSMAAIIGHQSIYIRLESLKTIFFQKWVQIFDYNEFDILSIHSEPLWNIAEGVKQEVLEMYGISTKDQLLEQQPMFIKDLSETILYHEFGHGILQQNMLSYELNAVGEASKVFGDNIYTAILEFLADFSPKNGPLMGPIRNIITISQTDRVRAKRMYLMYLSDTWFLNTTDTHMFTYSYFIVLILIRYITPTDIKFEQLSADMSHADDNSKTPYDRILTLYKNDVLELKTMVENATFLLNGDVSYPKLREYLISEFRKNDGYVYEDTYEFLVPFWTNIFGYARSSSNSSQYIEQFLNQKKDSILKKIMVLSCGKDMALKYDYDHQRYIIDHLYKLKLIAVDPNS